MKKITALLLSIAMILSLSACEEKKEETTSIAETTEITTTPLKDINLDNKHTLNDVIVPFPSDWKFVDSDPADNIKYIHGEGGLVMLASKKYDTEKACKEKYEFHSSKYKNFAGNNYRTITVSGVDITEYSWEPTDGYSKTYVFQYNNGAYVIDFYASTDQYENCSMYNNSETIIKSLQFKTND